MSENTILALSALVSLRRKINVRFLGEIFVQLWARFFLFQFCARKIRFQTNDYKLFSQVQVSRKKKKKINLYICLSSTALVE